MPFEYYSQGVSKFFVDFTERVCSQLALAGTEITNKAGAEPLLEMDVKYKDETGRLQFIKQDLNIKTVYTVKKRTLEEAAEKATEQGVMFGALGGLAGGILKGDKEAAIGAVGGAVGGGVHGALEGKHAATDMATAFAILLANSVKGAEDQLQAIMQGQQEAASARSEASRELRDQLDETYGEILTLKEECSLSEGPTAKDAKARVDRAEQLYNEAIAALDAGRVSETKAKMVAARNLAESAKSKLGTQ
jgi:hypothetical protein